MSCNTIKGKPYAPETKYIETEVLVLGGGLPGVCAAIQASEMGIKTVLVESRLTLGGNCGPEVGVHPSDAHRFHPYMVSTGTVGKLIEDAAFFNAKTRSEDNHYNISLRWDTIMSKALEHAGVTVLLSHYAHTPYVDNNKITAVLAKTRSHTKEFLSASAAMSLMIREMAMYPKEPAQNIVWEENPVTNLMKVLLPKKQIK